MYRIRTALIVQCHRVVIVILQYLSRSLKSLKNETLTFASFYGARQLPQTSSENLAVIRPDNDYPSSHCLDGIANAQSLIAPIVGK